MSASLYLEVLGDADLCKVMIRVVHADEQQPIATRLLRLCKATKQAVYTGFLHSTPRPGEVDHFIARWNWSRSTFTSMPAYVPVDHLDARRYERFREMCDPGEMFRRNGFVDECYDEGLKFPVFEAVVTSLERQERLNNEPLADFKPFQIPFPDRPTLFMNQIAFSPTVSQNHERALITIQRRDVLYSLECFLDACHECRDGSAMVFVPQHGSDEVAIGRMRIKKSSLVPIADKLLLLTREHGIQEERDLFETLTVELRSTLPEGENHDLLMQAWTGMREVVLQDSNQIPRRFYINLRKHLQNAMDQDPQENVRCLSYTKIRVKEHRTRKRCLTMLAKNHARYPTNFVHMLVSFEQIVKEGASVNSVGELFHGKLSVGRLTHNNVLMVATHSGFSMKTGRPMTGTPVDGIMMSREQALALLGSE